MAVRVVALLLVASLAAAVAHTHASRAQGMLLVPEKKLEPSPPHLVTVAAVKRNALTLSWRPPVVLGPNVTEYRVQMATYPEDVKAGEHHFTNADFVGKCRTPELECAIDGLLSGGLYRFRVRAGVNGAFGSFSQPLDFSFPTVPPPPSSPMSVRATGDSLTLQWEPPIWPSHHAHANVSMLSPERLTPVLGYEVETGEGPASPLKLSFRAESNHTVQTLEDLTAGSIYRFRVRAWNVIGYSVWSDIGAAFTNTNVPGPVNNVTFADIGLDSVRIDWLTPTENGGRVNRYDILMLEENGVKLQHPRVAASVGGGDHTAVLDALHPGWAYAFRVRGRNGNGAGTWGSVQHVRLLDPIPNRPPPPIATERSPTGMKVEFEPARNASGAVIKEFELAVAQEQSLTHTEGFASAYKGTRRHFFLKHLVVGGCYRLRVRTISDTGTISPWSHDGRACTSSLVPATPLPPHALNETTSSLTVRWSEPPARGSPILRYHLEMMGPAMNPEVSENDLRTPPQPLSVRGRYTRVYTGPSLQFDAPTLLPDTIYSFRVIAENDVGESLPSNASMGRTLPLVPDAPPPPTLVGREWQAVRVELPHPKPGPYHTLPVDAIDLQAAEGGEGESGSVALWTDVYSGLDATFTLDGLMPNSAYRLRTRARNAVGVSAWSKPLTATTTSAAPEPVDDVRIAEKDPSHVVVTWTEPRDNGEPVRSYHVEVAVAKDKLQRRMAGDSKPAPLGDWKVVQTGARTNATLLDNLHIQRGDFFAVRVRAANTAGQAPFSAPLAAWARPGDDGLPFPPDQVRRPSVGMVASRSAVVSWERPDNNGAPIARFHVEVAELDDSVCESNPALGKPMRVACGRELLSPDSKGVGKFEFGCETTSDATRRIAAPLSCKLDGLEPGSKYLVRVTALNFVGESYPSPSALLVLFEDGHGMPPVPTRPYIAHADTTSVLVRWTNHTIPNSGTSQAISHWDLGLARVPPALAHRVMKLDAIVKASARARLSAVAIRNATASNATDPADEDKPPEAAYAEMMDLLRGLPYMHVHRVASDDPVAAEAGRFSHRVEGLNAGGAYAFTRRGVDGETKGPWGDAAFVALSPDVPLAPAAPRLKSASSSSLTLVVPWGDAQGSNVTETVLEMTVPEDVATGKWSPPRKLAAFTSPVPTVDNVTGEWYNEVVVTSLPPNTPFGFRSSSTNAMGEGPTSGFARFFTTHSELPVPKIPEVVVAAQHTLAVKFSLPQRGDEGGGVPTVIPAELPAPKPVPNVPGRYETSGTDFLYANHQGLDAPPSPQATFQMVADVGPKGQGELLTVCNTTRPGCEVPDLRPDTTYHFRARVVEAWGPSGWSLIGTARTARAQPDPITDVTVATRPLPNGLLAVDVSWLPPSPNGERLLGFDVLFGRVPANLVAAATTAVSTRLPPRARQQSETDGLRPYLLTRALSDDELPSGTANEEAEKALRGSGVELVPNRLSPEAVATAKRLPPPTNPPPDPNLEFDRKDLVEDGDFLASLLHPVAKGLTNLSHSFVVDNVPDNETAVYVVRVVAANKRGAGYPSPPARFFASNGPQALPPNQPKPPTVTRLWPDSADLEWQPPQDNGPAVNAYELRLLSADLTDKSEFLNVYVGPDTRASLSKLSPGKRFYAYVVAHNAGGTSPPSSLLRFETPPRHG